jgi:pyruvate formate lyase activating enzyme
MPLKKQKEAYLYEKLAKRRVKCLNCAHYCEINPGSRGICGVRENKNGKLIALNYGLAASVQIDPIEKKPLFHFLPGSQTLSVAAVGCNFSCLNCQNSEISQTPKTDREILGQELPPKEIVAMAKSYAIPSISYTYVEPTIFSEYAFDTMKLAAASGIKNIWVTNGFLSKEVFDMVSPNLDAVNIDIKGFTDDFYQKNCGGGRLQPVLDTCKRMKETGIWTEITTLVIPALNDSPAVFKNIAEFIAKELGKDVPWHVTRFSGLISWKLKQLPETPDKTLKLAHDIGMEAGLKYVYTGNIPSLPFENTMCPSCGELCIEREGYIIDRYDLKGKCPACGKDLNIIE